MAATHEESDDVMEEKQSRIRHGRYPWQLFIITGLGWFADTSVGLIVGATTRGIMADLIGRRPSLNVTLFLYGLFRLAAGGAPNFVTFCSIALQQAWALESAATPCIWNIFQSHQWRKVVTKKPSKLLEHIARRNGRSITVTFKDPQVVSGDTTSKPATNLSTGVRDAFFWNVAECGSYALILPVQMYGLLHAYTPEVFRLGTGDALCSALIRIGGFTAPLIISTTPSSSYQSEFANWAICMHE
ncbi:hypothetical protein P692DRAFT_20817782 [Suillus brevipes Sb2]|nr:hypothetical protein P692DRAFT_20817782 [Suillus brevipes Sb2]